MNEAEEKPPAKRPGSRAKLNGALLGSAVRVGATLFDRDRVVLEVSTLFP